jgi:hypothetical protein
MLADNLLGLIALDPLGAGVPACHPSVETEHIDRVVGDPLDEQLKLLLATPQRRFGAPLLRFERLVQPVFAAHHAQGDTDKGGKLSQRACVTAVEVPFPIGDDPQCSQGKLAAEIKRYEQNLGYDDVRIGDPAIGPLGMLREYRGIAVERNAAPAEIPRGCRPIKRGKHAPQILPAEYAGGRVVFVKAKPRRNPAGYFQSEIDEPRQDLFRLISHPARQILNRQLFLKIVGLFRRAPVELIGDEHIGDG